MHLSVIGTPSLQDLDFFDVHPLEEMFVLKAKRLPHPSDYSKQLHPGKILKATYSEGRSNEATALGKYPASTFGTVK